MRHTYHLNMKSFAFPYVISTLHAATASLRDEPQEETERQPAKHGHTLLFPAHWYRRSNSATSYTLHRVITSTWFGGTPRQHAVQPRRIGRSAAPRREEFHTTMPPEYSRGAFTGHQQAEEYWSQRRITRRCHRRTLLEGHQCSSKHRLLGLVYRRIIEH